MVYTMNVAHLPAHGVKYVLTLSWRRPLSYRNQSTDLLRKSMDWFLCDNGLRHERVKCLFFKKNIKILIQLSLVLYWKQCVYKTKSKFIKVWKVLKYLSISYLFLVFLWDFVKMAFFQKSLWEYIRFIEQKFWIKEPLKRSETKLF